MACEQSDVASHVFYVCLTAALRVGGGVGSLEAGGKEPGSGGGDRPLPATPCFFCSSYPPPHHPALTPGPQSMSLVRRAESASWRVERTGIPRPCSCWSRGKSWLGSWRLGRDNMGCSDVSAATATGQPD